MLIDVLCAELVLIDPPMAKLSDEWDARILNGDEWCSIFQDLRHVLVCGFTIAIYCMPEMYALIYEELKKCNFVGITPLYWIKCDTNQNGSPAQFLNAAQMLIIGSSSPDHHKLQKGFSKNPLERHNVRHAKGKRDPYKHTVTGQVLNSTEKPPEIAEFLCHTYLRGLRTQRVLVLGSGAGGDVMGALQGGFNVIYIDKDKDQMEQLALRIRTKQATMEHEQKMGELEPDCKGLVISADYNRVSQPWLLPFCPRMSAAEVMLLPPAVEPSSQDPSAAGVAAPGGVTCVACGGSEGLGKCTGCTRMLCQCNGADASARACGNCPGTKKAVSVPEEKEGVGEEGQ